MGIIDVDGMLANCRSWFGVSWSFGNAILSLTSFLSDQAIVRQRDFFAELPGISTVI